MNIVHLISGGDAGGAKTHVLGLLAGIMKTENILLICFIEGDFAREAREMGIPIKIVANADPLRAAGKVRALVQEHKAQILHCHGARANMIGVMLRRKLSVPVITTVHSDYRLDYLGRPMGRLTYGSINAVCLRFMDYYIGVSDPMADLLISRGFDPQRIYAIYNGIDFTPRIPAMLRSDYLRSVGLTNCDDCVVFGIAARFSAVKDVATLIRGFGLAASELSNIRLLIAGDGEQRQELEQLAKELCPAGSYSFCGWVSDMDSFYNALDVNTLTSLSETFPYALTEGVRMHCATIASHVGGVPRLIDDGVSGLLFPAKDHEKLAEHIRRLASDAALRRQLGEALYEKASTMFSAEATVSRQLAIYRSVLARYARKSRKRDGVMICGAYGRDNAGDDAILDSIVTQMRQLDPEIPMYVLTRKPLEAMTKYRIGAIYTFRFGSFCRKCRKTALYLNGGGSLIQDVTSTRSLWYYLMSIAAAKRSGNRVLMYGCGIGPVMKKRNRKLAGRIINDCADVVTLREEQSVQELASMGVSRPVLKVTADPAILLPPAPRRAVARVLKQYGVAEQETFCVFALRNWKGMQQRLDDFRKAAVYAAGKGMRPVFLAMEPKADMEICRCIAEQTGAGAVCIPAPSDSRVLVGLLAQARLVTAMRLHALIFATGVGTPLVGVAYDPKVTGFMEYIGNPACLVLEKMTADSLCAACDLALEGGLDYDAIADKLQKLAMENAEEARRLLGEIT